MNRYERHQEICKLLTETYKKKNEDYGNSFGNTFEKLGLVSAVTRIADKVNRLESLSVKSEKDRLVKDEKIEDTLLDLANYSIMTLIELEREKLNRKDKNKA